MIGGVSHALHGVQVASAGFDRAATRVVEATTDGIDVGGVTRAAVAMLAARYALMASLQAARTSNEMVAQVVELVG